MRQLVAAVAAETEKAGVSAVGSRLSEANLWNARNAIKKRRKLSAKGQGTEPMKSEG